MNEGARKLAWEFSWSLKRALECPDEIKTLEKSTS